MKRTLLLFSGILLTTALSAQTQLGNSDMEAWENIGNTNEEPTNWNSFKSGSGGLVGFASQQIQRSTAIRAGATGSYCARIWSKSTLGIVANGNMTLGRINMGSSTPSSTSNYNYSQTADPNFSEAYTGHPDSIVFWVKYTPITSSSQARVSVVLHTSVDFKDPNDVGGTAQVATAILNYPSTGGQWVRKSVPFNYTGPATSNTYILATFTTNMTPGGGDANDEVLIDDIQLIYNQPPVANDDAVTTSQDVSVDVDVAANDTDPENGIDVTSVTIVTQPTNGTVSVNPTTGVVTYTPNAGYFGTDSFVYSICDDGVPPLCDQATVTVTVNQATANNDPIIANDDAMVTDMDLAVGLDVTANDIDPEGNILHSSLTVTVQPTNGITSVNTVSGVITYTPNTSFIGTDGFTYEICDGDTPQTCDQAVVTVTVNDLSGIVEYSNVDVAVIINGNELKILSTEELKGTYTIYASSGTIVQDGSVSSPMTFNAENGVYFMRMTTQKGEFVRKFVKH